MLAYNFCPQLIGSYFCACAVEIKLKLTLNAAKISNLPTQAVPLAVSNVTDHPSSDCFATDLC